MRFMVDESTGPKVARWLREQQQEVFSVYDEARSYLDSDLIMTTCFAQEVAQRDAYPLL